MTSVALLCIDSARRGTRKQLVTLCGGVLPRINLRSPRIVPIGTPVRLRNGRQTAKGVVHACRSAKRTCVLTIQIEQGGQWLCELLSGSGGYDPGVHLVNQFITDQQLSQVMDEMDSKCHSAG
jgi:hypothetical protein